MLAKTRLSSAHPRQKLGAESLRLNAARERLGRAARRCVEKESGRFDALRRQLELLSPYGVLARGYAIVTKGESVVTSCEQADQGDELRIRLGDGALRARVLTRD